MAQVGYVYIVYGQGTNYIKIGKTTNIIKRFQQLQNGIPFQLQLVSVQLVHDMETAESALLEEYRHFQTRGEWFALPEEMLRRWPLDSLLPAFIKETTERKGKRSEQPRSNLAQSIMFLFEEHSALSAASIYEALEASTRRAQVRIRVAIHRLIQDGVIENTVRGVYRLTESQPSVAEVYEL